MTTAAGGPDGMPLALKLNEGLGHNVRNLHVLAALRRGAPLHDASETEAVWCDNAAAEIERLQAEIDRRFGIGGELIVARRDRDEALHKTRIAEAVLERLVRRCEAEMADTIDVPEIQTAKALLGLGA